MKKLLAIWACLKARWAKAKAPASTNEWIASANADMARAKNDLGALMGRTEHLMGIYTNTAQSATTPPQYLLAPQSIPPQGTKPMAAVDLSPLAAEFEAVSAYLAKLASGAESAVQLQADLDAEKKAHADTQALLDAANADAVASAKAVADMAAKYASLVPAA